jgi:exodeoxyribonuclease-3
MLKVATWNVNSIRTRLSQLAEWLNKEQPDIVGLQELKLSDHEFPNEALNELGYKSVYLGQKSYNGVAILSKEDPKETITGIPGFEDSQARVIATTVGAVRFLSIYAPNGQALDSDKYQYKLEWFTHLKNYLTGILIEYPNTIVVGDFNVAPEDRDVHNPAAWRDSVLVSPAERTAFFQLLELGLIDTFRLFDQAHAAYTWWDYRNLGFERNHGLRIDHILANTNLALSCGHSWVDLAPRKNERPSDHAPVVSEFYI